MTPQRTTPPGTSSCGDLQDSGEDAASQTTSKCCSQCCENCQCNKPQKRPCNADDGDSGCPCTKKSKKTDEFEGNGNGKIFSDPIHGHILLHPACIVVIDTPEFQRLRDIKQLGMGYFVYPGAAHNRFEHSLGVCHLAGQFVKQLRDNQPELGINNKDILCIELAALCHDIGHGPFSHLFDHKVVPLLEGLPLENKRTWKHEFASKEIFEFIYENNDRVRTEFHKYGLGPTDIAFIKELIAGPTGGSNQSWPYQGREEDKAFLYEIVANKRNGIDVDKWDYIARDCHQLGIRNSFDHSRFMKFARVIVGKDGRKQICLRDKELINLYTLFTSRYLLHKTAYQHKVICGLEIMVRQAIIKAQNDLRFDNFSLTDILRAKNWKAYTLMTDNILYKIRDADGDSENLKAAKEIIERIFKRDLYRCIHESKPYKPGDWKGRKEGGGKESTTETEARIKQEIIKEAEAAQINDEDFFVQIVSLDFGMKDENPLEKISVYSKGEPDVAKKIKEDEMSTILKHYSFTEQMLRIYATSDNKKNAIERAYDKWRQKNFDTQQDEVAGPSSRPDTQSARQRMGNRCSNRIGQKHRHNSNPSGDTFG